MVLIHLSTVAVNGNNLGQQPPAGTSQPKDAQNTKLFPIHRESMPCPKSASMRRGIQLARRVHQGSAKMGITFTGFPGSGKVCAFFSDYFDNLKALGGNGPLFFGRGE
jgi:hypothetical protein